ncbi:hypothetical protein KI387_043237 [Taxus chinensis]|uniref:Xylanase inhibitor C-terminal domain-containing protein n=1 Tax=Taxus chinensis TaxID=29808 RepID=A0AA38BZE7_TAXCH|nr:hypothetical protein KI387_043237 [Taxus chinensis]
MANAEDGPMVKGLRANMKRLHPQTPPSWRRPQKHHKAQNHPNLHSFCIKGISVGNSVANNIPEGTFDLKGDGNGGFIIDSGTTLTFLPHAAFTAVAQLLDSAVGLPREAVIQTSIYATNCHPDQLMM